MVGIRFPVAVLAAAALLTLGGCASTPVDYGKGIVHVVAVITAKPGMRDSILQAVRANLPAIHAEKGCIEYGATIDMEGAPAVQTKWGADTFVIIEKWESMEAFKAHLGAPHMAAYGAKVKDMVAARRIYVLSPS